MAEVFSNPPHAERQRNPEEDDEPLETRLAHLIEYVSHNVYRPATRDRHEEVAEIFRELLADLLKELGLSQVEAVVEHLEERLKRGQHDLVVEFLSNLAKLQHADFGQEFLRLQAVPIPVDDISDEEAAKLGHTVITNF